MNVISKGLRYKGKEVPEDKKIENVPDGLAQRWVRMGFAKPVKEYENKEYEKETKPDLEKRDNEAKEKNTKSSKVKNENDKEQKDKITIDDLEKKKGGHYYLDGEHFAHGEKEVKEKLEELNEG